MMLLVSFPRSGNTFFRNILYEVYGLSSSTYHQEKGRVLEPDWAVYPIIKTHLLPDKLPAKIRNYKVVYLVRDGRDAMVSLAHHRKDIIEPGSDYETNLLEAILAKQGSYFGGWSHNVKLWTERADLIIRFEDLIADPVAEVEKLRSIIDLPPPQKEKLPTFENLKFGRPKYGSGGTKHNQNISEKNFRKGKKESWSEEMSLEVQRLFWRLHGGMMREMGYTKGAIDYNSLPPRKVLIEASKLFTNDNDGVKRYISNIIAHFPAFIQGDPRWEIHLLNRQKVVPLTVVKEVYTYEDYLLAVKHWIQRILPDTIYEWASNYYRQGPFRAYLSKLRQNTDESNLKASQEKFAADKDKFDLVHFTLPQHVQNVSHFSSSTVLTVHDLTHRLLPGFHTSANIERCEKGMQMASNSKTEIIAISHSTKNDVLELYNIPAERIRVIYEAAAVNFYPHSSRAKLKTLFHKLGIPNYSYFICLSTVEPRKNLDNVVKAFQKLIAENSDLKTQLIVCGKYGWGENNLFENKEKLAREGIHFTGFVPDHQLPLLLSHAISLCYISHYEGFGLPILEAMSCGTPVIYGNNSSQKEVAENGGLGVDAKNIDEIKTAMYTLLANEEMREQLKVAAILQAKKFSWLKAAFQTLCAYENIIAAKNA